jgi:hypothetical protein
MKTKIIGILVCMLLIATAIPAVGTMNDKETAKSFGILGNNLKYPSSQRNNMKIKRGSMFIQMPYLANATSSEWGAPTSDKDEGYLAYDDFWDISEPICDIHWWGLAGETNSIPGDPTGMIFNITFNEDDGTGKPGNVVYKYSDIAPTIVTTGIVYYYEPTDTYWPLYYFTDVTLDPCCEMSEGWVSIQSQNYLEIGVNFGWEPSPNGNGVGWQVWIPGNIWYERSDFAYVLTDGKPAEPDLECGGNLDWKKVKPGADVTGSFKVRNNGDAGSILNWNISSYPKNDWGTNWTFTPKASVLTKDMGWITVDVNVTAPDEKNKEFTGKIKVVNAVDPSDNCEIDVVLKTPKNKPYNINLPFQRFLENHPNIFPLLRQLLGV